MDGNAVDQHETEPELDPGAAIALVGMAGRFPGARGVRALWENLRAGRDSITRFGEDELRAAGVSAETLADPSYVRAGSVLDGIDAFDAGFFGYTPTEARLLDPQQRLFLENAWYALEDAGLAGGRSGGVTGVIAGCAISTYLLQNLLGRADLSELVGEVAIGLANDKDSLATRVAYDLDLTGPTLNVQSYCSSSLVAVAQACSALLAGEADTMLAGGVTVDVPHRVGYHYQQAGMTSPDGRCRAFDAAAEGTPVGSGVGVVVLRRLEDALADGDRVYAVIPGWAVNNDGGDKVGFTAPGVRGQSTVIAEALGSAGLTAADIDYVEAHGTGTALGDAVEIAALQRIFDVDGVERFAIGSVKTNLGHLDRASGVTGLIKAALALYHGEIPPTLHHETPNPQLGSSGDRIRVVTELRPWPRGGRIRRAGVSSSGIGGTNAHLVLQETPELAAAEPAGETQLLVWSARDAEAGDALQERLRVACAASLDDEPDDGRGLADLAYTLQAGRSVFEHRRAAVVTSRSDAAAALGPDAAERVLSRRDATTARPVSFLLAGVGEHYRGMLGELHRTEPVVRDALDECAAEFRARLGSDPTRLFLGEREAGGSDLAGLLGRSDAETDPGTDPADDSADTRVIQPAMFAADYAIGRLLMSWGIRPRIMLGYSVGEFAAAALSGSLDLADAAALVATRAELISELPRGAMAAVPASVARLVEILGPIERTGVDVGAVNGPDVTVLSGPGPALDEVTARLAEAGLPTRPLRTTHAFHSAMLRPVADRLTEWVRSELRPRTPEIPYLSTVTGAPITEAQLQDPGYWAEHMCRPVQFSDMLSTLLAGGEDVLLEVGPGQSLGAMARNHPDCGRDRWPLLVPTLPAQADPTPAPTALVEALGRSWLAGVDVDWAGVHAGRDPRKTTAPDYPFRRSSYWVDPPAGAPTTAAAVADVERAVQVGTAEAAPASDGEPLVPVWTAAPLVDPGSLSQPGPVRGPVWILADAGGVGAALAERLSAEDLPVRILRPGSALEGAGADGDSVRPGEVEDYRALLDTADAPASVVHLWGLDAPTDPAGEREFLLERGFAAVVALTCALGDPAAGLGPVSLLVATDTARAVRPTDRPDVNRAAVFGPCLVAPQEFANLGVRSVDLTPDEDAADLLRAELGAPFDGTAGHAVAWRAGERLTQGFEPEDPSGDEPVLPREGGTYLVTGGLGPVGALVAGHLGTEYGARVVLAGRHGLPPEAEWDGLLADPEHPLRARIQSMRGLAERGVAAEAVALDVTDEAALRGVVDDIVARHGRLDGVVHLAGVTDPDSYRPLTDLGPQERDVHLLAKVEGARTLERVLADGSVDFCLLFSSMSSVLGGVAFGSYAAANSCLDAVAGRHVGDETRWLTVNWDTWASTAAQVRGGALGATLVENSLSEAGALAAIDAVLARPRPRTVISAGGLPERLDRWTGAGVAPQTPAAHRERGPRPDLAQPYVPPIGSRQRRLAELWSELLGVDGIGGNDNFADLGGTSLMALQLVRQIKATFGVEITAVTLFEAPTVRSMADVLAGSDVPATPEAPAVADPEPSAAPSEPAAPRTAGPAPDVSQIAEPIAVVGMAGRFPGAVDVTQFWANLRDGIESVTRFTEQELLDAGVPPELVHDENYVPARPVLDDIRSFDAGFFGYSPRDAAITDPQHRIFLETCWHALEDSGYGTERGRGRVGVFGGSNMSSYLLRQVMATMGESEADVYSSLIGNAQDSLATTVSYKLGLTGPSLSVQTFCSTALVALHLAVQSLRGGECEMALAGGAGVHVPDRQGHLYTPGGMESPDGHVRTFDAQAAGTMFGDGSAVVVLKRLSDAIAAGDTVHAVVRGSAINNDGSVKVGYTAPSVVGQSRVVSDAMAAAGVSAEDVGYIEAHGTATPLGDPIEVKALVSAFGPTEEKQYCRIGSVKTNIGHLGAAAGATGLIKTVLALANRQIPPSLHFESANPEIDFPGGPFRVNTELSAWEPVDGRPRIAGINSLGMGGTNVHVVVEEAPEPVRAQNTGADRRYEIVPVSARTETAADEAVARLAAHVRDRSDVELMDAAHTLQVGRQLFEHRRVLVADSLDAVGADPTSPDAMAALMRRREPVTERPVDFLLAGVGEQYPGVVGELYRREPVFRAAVDECGAVLRECAAAGTGTDADVVGLLTGPRAAAGGGGLASMLGREAEQDDPAADLLARTEVAQPAMFVVGYAMAKLVMSWGVAPDRMLGYSLGEYVAACLADVLSPAEALQLVAFRAQLIAELPAGAMLAVPLAPDALTERFGDLAARGLDLAVLNGPEQTVLGGTPEAVREFAAELERAGMPARTLATSHAFHTRMLEPARERLTAFVRDHLVPRAPVRDYFSNVTGQLATVALVADPGYWAAHMCSTVRFADGLAGLLADPDTALLELGPGQSLGAMARVHPDCARDRWPLVVPTLSGAADPRPDDRAVADAVARLWLGGTPIDWAAYQAGRGARRIPLPGYPFQRSEYWLEPAGGPRKAGAAQAQTPAEAVEAGGTIPLPKLPERDWLHTMTWRQKNPRAATPASGRWLVLTDTGPADALCAALRERLVADGAEVVLVRPSASGDEQDGTHRVEPGDTGQIRELLRGLRDNGGFPDHVVHLWGLEATEPIDGRAIDTAMARGTDTLVALAAAANDVGAGKWSLDIVTSGTCAVTGAEALHPELALLTGPLRVIPLEYPDVRCRLVDLDPVDPDDVDPVAARLATELTDGSGEEPVVALRHGRSWCPDYASVPISEVPEGQGSLRDGGVYLVTGGLGGIGLAMAERLARDHQARLVLFGRTGLPPREQWRAALDDPAAGDEVRRRLTGVLRLEELGAEVEIVTGDVADAGDARAAVQAAVDRFGALHGVVHAAGLPGIGLMQFKTRAEMRKVMAPKVEGTLALHRALREVPGAEADFLMLFSSITSATGGGPGQVDYCCANAFLDGYAGAAGRDGPRVLAIGWGEWEWNGWEAGLAGYDPAVQEFFRRNRREFGIDFEAGWGALRRALGQPEPHVIVNTQDFSAYVRMSRDFTVEAVATDNEETGRHPRPDLITAFVPPEPGAQTEIAEVWAELLGVEEVGANDSFFDLGGNSLIGMEVMVRIRRRLSVDELAPHLLYEAPSVAALAAVLGDRPAEEPADDSASRSAAQRKRGLKRRRPVEGESA